MPDPSNQELQVGLQLRLMVGNQVVPININNVKAVQAGKEPIILQNENGVTLRLEDFKKFLEEKFGVKDDAIPKPVNDLLGNTSITLNELYLIVGGDFKFSITVGFDKDGKGGALTSLLGVDMSGLLDIQEVTIGLWRGNIPAEYKGVGPKTPRLAAPQKQLPEKPEKPDTEE
jgi:hypothetical protein